MQNLADTNANLQPLSQLALTALPRHAYVCHRHYSGALTQGSLLKFAQNLIQWYKSMPPLCKAPEATPPALPRHAYVCERRPTTPQSACAASSPYTGEPIEVCANLQPLSQLALTAPLTQGSLLKFA